jgi:predicted transcriptional regulator
MKPRKNPSRSMRVLLLEQAIAKGYSKQRISRELGISRRTLDRYLERRRQDMEEMLGPQVVIVRQMLLTETFRQHEELSTLIDKEKDRLAQRGENLSFLLLKALDVENRIRDSIARLVGIYDQARLEAYKDFMARSPELKRTWSPSPQTPGDGNGGGKVEVRWQHPDGSLKPDPPPYSPNNGNGQNGENSHAEKRGTEML